jgi:hypothetical protein
MYGVCLGLQRVVKVGVQDLVRTDTVLAYQRIRLFVWANSMKTVNSDTYQEIPDTGHF